MIHIAFVFSNGDPALVARQFVFAPLATQNNVGMVQYATDPLTTELFRGAEPGAGAGVGGGVAARVDPR